MRKQKIFSYLILIMIFIIPNVVFATDYSTSDMENRETVTKDGETVIAQGEPVMAETRSWGLVATEPFIGNDGNYYPAGTPLIVYDENGRTGNTREQNQISFKDPTMGYGGNVEMFVDVLAEPVLVVTSVDVNGNTVVKGYNLPSAEIGNYTGNIFSSPQEYIEFINEKGYFTYSLPDGETELTIESYTRVFGEDALYNKSVLYNESFESMIVKPIYKDGKLVYEGIDESIITALLAFGSTPDQMQNLLNLYKLYAVYGEDIPLDELLDLYIGGPEPGTIPEGEWSEYGPAEVSASVWSNIYNVGVAIPTSEMVYGSISASEFSWYYKVKATADFQEYTINNITLYWDPYQQKVPIMVTNASGELVESGETWKTFYRHSEKVNITGIYITHYFSVEEANMNKVANKVNGQVIGGGNLSNGATGALASLGVSGASGYIDRSGGIVFDDNLIDSSVFNAYGEDKEIAIANAQQEIAERIKEASYVKNDKLVIQTAVLGGQTELGEEFKETPYLEPSFLQNPSSGTMSGGGEKMIPSSVENGEYSSSAVVSYLPVEGFDNGGQYNKSASASSVFVHTPVVNEVVKDSIVVDNLINQKINQEESVRYLTLDEYFTVVIPKVGTHINAKGYDTREYNAFQAVPQDISNWGKLKDIKLPFDAYLQPYNTLVKAGTWLSDLGLATAQSTYTFLIPVWAEEAAGEICVRVVAENAGTYVKGSEYDVNLVQNGANTDWTKYVAESTISVEVVGKIYDLRVSGTNDPAWENLKGENGNYISETEFPFGQAGQNKIYQYKFAPKLGYVVEFDFKTKGIKTDNVDVSIQPEGFYFVSKNGGEAVEVDLYYQTTNRQYVKLALNGNNSDIIVNLSNKFMKVAVSELTDSKLIMGTLIGVTYNYNENVKIGKLPKLNIPENLRLCYNNFSEYVNELYKKSQAEIILDATNGLAYDEEKFNRVVDGNSVVKASVGHWYAGYRLPSSTIAVPKGTGQREIINNPEIAKKNGYILVKFDIIGKDNTENYLKYIGPKALNESPMEPAILPNGKPATVPDGTVLIFETDLKANNDYEVIGTH